MIRLLRIVLLTVAPLVAVATLAGCEDDVTASPADMAVMVSPQDQAVATHD